jgi:hypothetical protein
VVLPPLGSVREGVEIVLETAAGPGLRHRHGLGNRTVPAAATGPPEELASEPTPKIGRIRCQRFLGGLLRHYYRDAA